MRKVGGMKRKSIIAFENIDHVKGIREGWIGKSDMSGQRGVSMVNAIIAFASAPPNMIPI